MIINNCNVPAFGKTSVQQDLSDCNWKKNPNDTGDTKCSCLVFVIINSTLNGRAVVD